MVVETAQLLSTAHRVIDGTPYIDDSSGRRIKRWRLNDEREQLLYKASHVNHPSAVWARANKANYRWLWFLFASLCEEYTHRYQKTHLTEQKLFDILSVPPEFIPSGTFYPPPPAMKQYPQCIVEGDSIQSYHNYYRVAKADFAVWTNRPTPKFMEKK